MVARWVASCALALCLATSAAAQTVAGSTPENVPPLERIEIGLSTESVAITSDFDGTDLIIFGAVDNVDPLVQRQGRYDIFLVLEGPRSDVVTRRKSRVFGIWMNARSQTFDAPPQSYLIASTRQPRDATDQGTIKRLSLAINDVRIRPAEAEAAGDVAAEESTIPVAEAETVAEFTEAFRRLKVENGLYRLFPGNVQFISQSLFRAKLDLPANVPLGEHRAIAFLFRNGQLVAQTQAPLRIAKAGIEFQIFRFAQEHSLYYGLASVFLALLVGWLGRVFFKKD